MTAYEQLKNDLDIAWRHCLQQAKIWGFVYIGLRSLLIVFSALTSAKAVGIADFITGWQAVFALLVTILTAFDTWLRPGRRQRTNFRFNDEYSQLFNDLLIVNPNDPNDPNGVASLKKINQQYKTLNERYRKELD